MISLKSFSAEQIFDLQLSFLPFYGSGSKQGDTFVPPGTFIISADIFGYQDWGGAPHKGLSSPQNQYAEAEEPYTN